MARKDVEQFNLRLNLNNPNHLKIYRTFQDLNTDIHKSRNNFIIEALLRYINGISEEDLTFTGAKKKQEADRYVTQSEIAELETRITAKVMKEVAEMMGRAALGNQGMMINPMMMQSYMQMAQTTQQEAPNAYLYEYLTNDRAISRDVVNFFVEQGLIYESIPYHNIVFKGNDKDGVTRFASMRGVFDKKGKPFKCDVPGNDKRYGFNIANEASTELVVFEAAIDLMSYMDIHRDFESNMIALGMVADAPLETFLKEHSQISSIKFCLDNDKAGRDAAEMLMEKYYQLDYDVTDSPPPKGCKDYNEWLVKAKAERIPELDKIIR